MRTNVPSVWAFAVCSAVLAVAAACASGPAESTALPSDTGTPATTTPGSPPVTGTPASSASSAALVLKTPEEAAKHLYDAWTANDKPTALLGATSSAVDALFAKTWSADTYFFGGCTTPTAPSECDYNWAQGAVKMQITGSAEAGHKVVATSFGSAG